MAGIPDDQMGDVWPTAQPGADGAQYGTLRFEGPARCTVRSFQTFRLIFTVGAYGLDDTGALKITHRWTSDGGQAQCTDPAAMNYASAIASNGVPLVLYAEPYPHQRPWYFGLRITVKGGYLSPGHTITVTYGDTSHGSPGMRLQTFPESAFAFKVLADVCATGVFLPIGTATTEIVAGPPETWVLTAPTLRRPNEPFSLGIRAEDTWGNPTPPGTNRLHITSDAQATGMPDSITFATGARGHRIKDLRISSPGTYRFTLHDTKGKTLVRSNPLVIREGKHAGYWGDLHGQSGETVGINPIAEYFAFARDVAFLDVTSHQGNDFQITNAFWQEMNDTAAAFDEDGTFTVFPGYEWSGNTALGGDHNVFFRHEDEQIHRSSHALLADRSDVDTDAPNLTHLFDKLQGRDCILYGHVGGRPADISFAEDARLRTAVEVHSDWGTFEWIMTDAFDLGYRVGLVCNSDGHKGAPGACSPGASEFGAYSGLTCFLAQNLTRDAVFDSLRARHHYGTTGCRMHLDICMHLDAGSGVFPTDPRLGPVDAVPANTAMMGDIVHSIGDTVDLDITVADHAPILRVDILNGAETLASRRPYGVSDLGNRLRVQWQGAEYRGRGRDTKWQGTLQTDQARITRFAKINAWNIERPFDQIDPKTVSFEAVTTGNFGGCDLWLDTSDGVLIVDTNLVQARLTQSDIGLEDNVLDAGGLDRKIRVFRLPEVLDVCDMRETVTVKLHDNGDNPIWVRVTTEDGFVAWSSPIYVLR